MALSLHRRILCLPRRMMRTLISSNTYHSRLFLSTETVDDNTNNNEDDNDKESESSSIIPDLPNEAIPPSQRTSTPSDYSHYLSEKPEYERGRKMRISMPAKSAGTQGVAKVGQWRVEAENPGARWGNPLMGWTSTRDPLQSINTGLERFETKEHAIQWCVSNGYDYEVSEPNAPRRRPKNYASTFARNGPPTFDKKQENDNDDK